MLMFPKLGERTVKFKGFDGVVYEAQKLGVGDADKVQRIIDEAAKETGDISVKISAREKLLEIVKPALPKAVADDAFRMGYFELVQLAMFLIYGTDEPESGEDKKKDPTTQMT